MHKTLIIVLLSLFIIGCQGARKGTSNKSNKKINFPKIMVGIWEADVNENLGEGSKWGIKFEPDGSIKKIIHSVAGPVDLREGTVSGEGPDEGMFYYFIMGPCTSEYNSVNKKLKVKIIVDEYLMKLPTGELKGRIEDVFDGPVSKDGKTWNVEWRNYGYMEGADPLDVNAVNASPDKLVFKKIDIERLKNEDPNHSTHNH